MAGGRAEFLVLKRAANEKIYPGIWQMVSGTMHDGERATDAALRELKEETGLSPLRFWVVPHVSVFYDHDYDAANLCPMFAAELGADARPALSGEHEHYAWLPHAEARSRLVWPSQREGLDLVQSYIVGGEEAAHLSLVPLP
jgi:dATP pyrophosphohydrolase